MAYLNVGVTAIRARDRWRRARTSATASPRSNRSPRSRAADDYARIARQVVAHRAGYLSVQGTITDLVGVQKGARGTESPAQDRGRATAGLRPLLPPARGRRGRGHLRRLPDHSVRRRRERARARALRRVVATHRPGGRTHRVGRAELVGRADVRRGRAAARRRTSTARPCSPASAPSTHGTATASRSPPTPAPVARPRASPTYASKAARSSARIPPEDFPARVMDGSASVVTSLICRRFDCSARSSSGRSSRSSSPSR